MELTLIDSNSNDDVAANEPMMMIKRTSRHSWASAPSINPFLIHRLLAICIYRNIPVINVFITFYYYLSIDCSFLFNSTLTCSNLQKQFDDDDGVLPRRMIDSIPTDTFPSCDGWVSISCFDLISILHLFCSSFCHPLPLVCALMPVLLNDFWHRGFNVWWAVHFATDIRGGFANRGVTLETRPTTPRIASYDVCCRTRKLFRLNRPLAIHSTSKECVRIFGGGSSSLLLSGVYVEWSYHEEGEEKGSVHQVSGLVNLIKVSVDCHYICSLIRNEWWWAGQSLSYPPSRTSSTADLSLWPVRHVRTGI